MDQAVLDWFRAGPDDQTEPGDDLPIEVTPPSPTTLEAADSGGRERLLRDYLCQEIGHLVHRPAETVDLDQTMTDLGVGSMIGLELQSRIREALGVAPELTTILRAENIRVLTRHLVGRLGAPEPGAHPA